MKGRAALAAIFALVSYLPAQLAPSHQPMQSQPETAPHGQMTVTQSGNPHGSSTSSLKTFAAACGVTELTESRVTVLLSGTDQKWRRIAPDEQGSKSDTSVARAFKDANGNVRVVDISKSDESGKVLQMSRMCFSPKGSLRKVSEHYVNIPACACGRTTEAAYEEQGKQTKRTQSWYQMPSREAIIAPANAATMPPVLEYRTVSALPFANLLKEKNATSH